MSRSVSNRFIKLNIVDRKAAAFYLQVTDFERASEYVSGETANLSLVRADSADLGASGFSVASLPPECYRAENPTVKMPGDIYG